MPGLPYVHRWLHHVFWTVYPRFSFSHVKWRECCPSCLDKIATDLTRRIHNWGEFEVLARRFNPLPGFHILSFSAPAPPQMGNPFYVLISPEPFSTESQQRRGGLFPQSYFLITDERLWVQSPYKPTTALQTGTRTMTCRHLHPHSPHALWSEHHGA